MLFFQQNGLIVDIMQQYSEADTFVKPAYLMIN